MTVAKVEGTWLKFSIHMLVQIMSQVPVYKIDAFTNGLHNQCKKEYTYLSKMKGIITCQNGLTNLMYMYNWHTVDELERQQILVTMKCWHTFYKTLFHERKYTHLN